MSTLRFKALEDVMKRQPVQIDSVEVPVSEYFGENVFGKKVMQNYLASDVYKQVMACIQDGKQIDRSIADNVALAMKAWAISKGVTHYTHWFQPLTGLTAEKHDAFFDLSSDGNAIEKFEGNQLAQQEPDASSFPNGGIRNTFEARGYTAWDPSSPAFIIGQTLCVPTIFVAYTGEALDYKTPLLKALHAVDKAAVNVCKYFDKDVTKVNATLGWEQEYFLIDTALYNARPDLVLTGRTLFGKSSSKGQQLDDHYFGSIPDRAAAFMKDYEQESLRLGIPVKTRHNEVAPNQFECAPVFEEANLAVDHTELLMDLMGKLAIKHNFKILLHEKPFAGMNGSGKHNNWSLATNTGVNLLSPGKTPRNNLRFLTFFINTIKAVHDYSDLLRSSIASASNDHRLGANEAPPAIISIFIGSQLTAVLNDLEKKVPSKKMTPDEKTELKLNIGKIPQILLDNTDRNRTSPFAFTGNKFELRAVGSSANCASAMTVLNTIVAKQLIEFEKEVDGMIKKGIQKDEAIFKILRGYIVHSKKILFEGNGYSSEWEKEAKKRGLPNIKTTPGALDVLTTPKVKSLYKELDIMSEVELEARHEIDLENYKLKIEIESRMVTELALNVVIPSALKFQNALLENVTALINVYGKKTDLIKAQSDTITAISQAVNAIKTNVDAMNKEKEKANTLPSAGKQAHAYCDKVKPYFDVVRENVDNLELIVADELWPLPKYRELLFTR